MACCTEPCSIGWLKRTTIGASMGTAPSLWEGLTLTIAGLMVAKLKLTPFSAGTPALSGQPAFASTVYCIEGRKPDSARKPAAAVPSHTQRPDTAGLIVTQRAISGWLS